MKKTLLTLTAALLSVLPVAAQDTGIQGDGYYRVRNKATQRFIYVRDNTSESSLDIIDYSAIQLWKGLDKTISDPASVMYVKSMGGEKYDILSQGTGIYQIISHYPNITKKSDGSYEVHATQSGVTKYLSDNNKGLMAEFGTLGDGGADNYRKWQVNKIDANGTNYFGITPTVSLGGKFYQPFYAAFPFTPASSGMKVYYISKIDLKYNTAVLKEITGTVPSKTPVIIECSSQNPSSNRLNIVLTDAAQIKDNCLLGNFFANDSRPKSKDAAVAFDESKMRVLTVANGKLAFGTTGSSIETLELYINKKDVDVDCLKSNVSYLGVTTAAQKSMGIMTEEEYNKLAVEGILADEAPAKIQGVYNLQGQQLRDDNVTNSLPSGLYIVGGRKVVVK